MQQKPVFPIIIGIDMVKLDSGELVLAFNPTGLGEDGKQSVGQSSKNIRNVDTGKLDKESHKQLLRVIRKLSPSHQDTVVYILLGASNTTEFGSVKR